MLPACNSAGSNMRQKQQNFWGLWFVCVVFKCSVQWHLLLALRTNVPSWQCFISIATVLVFQKANVRGKLNIRQGVKFFLENEGSDSSLWKYLYNPHRQHTARKAQELMHSTAVLLHWWRDAWAQIWTIMEWLGLVGTLKILLFQPSLGW